MTERFDKESVYDEQLYPLMDKIITICHEHQIPMVASFLLKGPNEQGEETRSTTALVGFKHTPEDYKRMNVISRYGTLPQTYAMTISRQEER